MDEELFTNNTPANNQTGNENINNTQIEPNQNTLQDVNNNGIPDAFEFTEKQDTTFVPQGNAFDNAYKSEEAIAKDIPDYKKYKWYKQPVEGYFYSTGEKIEEAIESNPEEVKETLNEIAKEDNGISKKDVQPLIKEAEQVTDGDERTSEVNNEVVDKTLENPKLEDLLNDELANFNEDDVIDEPDWEYEENAVSDEDIHPEGSTIIGDFDFKDPFERMNKKDLREKAKRIEKDIPIPRLTKKDINNKIINTANEGVGEDELSKIQKAYAKAKKPTKYEKEAAKAAGLIDNESDYNKMSKKEKKKLNEAIDEILEEQKKAGDEKRAKEAAKERVNKFFKPLQYERKVYANGRNRVLPKGTFMSPDGTEYYNPETETIEQVIEEPEKKEEEKERKKFKLPTLGGKLSFDIPATSEAKKIGSSGTSVASKSGVSPIKPSFSGGAGGGSISAGSVSNFGFEDKSDNTISEAGKGQSTDINVSERDANTGSLNGANSLEHLDNSLDELGFKDTKHSQEIESGGQAVLPNEEFHEKSEESFELKLPENPTNNDIISYLEKDSGNWENGDSKSKYLPFRFFVKDNELYGTVIGHGRPEKIEDFMKHEILAREKLSNMIRG